MMKPHTHSLTQLFKAVVTRPVGLILLTLAFLTPTTWAAEPVKISSLQTYPESYKMKVVQVEGTVSGYQMHHLAFLKLVQSDSMIRAYRKPSPCQETRFCYSSRVWPIESTRSLRT